MTEEIVQELYDRQQGLCALTGRPFELMGDWAASLDRIDSSQGYKRGNIRLVAWVVNHIKGDLSDDKFLGLCAAVKDGPVWERWALDIISGPY